MAQIWAKSGAKCVCINTDDTPGFIPETNLIKGVEYTIDRVEWHNWGLGFEGLGLYLEEIRREVPYGIFRFRPLITEADDIALFKSLLNPTLVDKLDLLAERMNELAED